MDFKKKKSSVDFGERTGNIDFSSVIPYKRSFFGLKDEQVSIYILDVTVHQLLNDFKIFEELNNVQSWPISTLIQRELDHDRAQRIAQDYLLNSGNTKYFPPLISVLIPTNASYLPKDSYDKPTDSSGIEQVRNKKMAMNTEKYSNFEDPFESVSGLFFIPFDDERGEILWDKNSLASVVIDGQHRYKALKEAVAKNRDMLDAKLTVTLIDIADICLKTSKSPTIVARDLFVTINNTPVEVDETRLVLMDDRDILSCLTQALVDDSRGDGIKSAIPPELNDWDCDGAKHNSEISLTGVLTLRQILLTSMFDNLKASSIDDRQKPRQIRRWLDRLNIWLDPDDEIEAAEGKFETFSHRYQLASSQFDTTYDVEDDDSLFLFTWSPVASQIVKEKFCRLYLPIFHAAFKDLVPYRRFYEIAANNGAFKPNSILNIYLRSFKGKRAEMDKDSEIKAEIAKYKSEVKSLTTDNLLFTVMGQKALFKVLFDNYLAHVDMKNSDVLLEETHKFITDFNELYLLLEKNKADLFSINYETKRKYSPASKLGTYFWGGIIRKINDELDYGNKAVELFSSVIADCLVTNISKTNFEFSKVRDIERRHIAQLSKLLAEDEDIRKDISEKAIARKAEQLNNLIITEI